MNFLPPLQVLKKYTGMGMFHVLSCWLEPHRKFHTEKHLNEVIKGITVQQNVIESEEEWEALILSAYFHDVVYWPNKTDNEEKSIQVMDCMLTVTNEKAIPLTKDIILSTKILDCNKYRIFNIFQTADCDVLINSDFKDLLIYEDNIFKEFSPFYSKLQYKKGRIEFLHMTSKLFTKNKENLIRLADFVNDTY